MKNVVRLAISPLAIIGLKIMNDLKFLQEIYPYDPEKHKFTIPISIMHYDEFFSRLDRSPAQKRDLSPELVEYLISVQGNYPADSTYRSILI